MKTCHAHEEKPKSQDTFDGGGYGIFWDEYHSIEQSKLISTTVVVPDNEDGAPNKEGISKNSIVFSFLENSSHRVCCKNATANVVK